MDTKVRDAKAQLHWVLDYFSRCSTCSF